MCDCKDNDGIMATNYDGRTIAHIAAAEGHRDLLLALQEAWFNFDLKDRWGQTPINEIKDPVLKEEIERIWKSRNN